MQRLRLHWLLVGGTAVLAILVVAGALVTYDPYEPTQSYALIADDEVIELAPGTDWGIPFNVPRFSTIGYELDPQGFETLACLIGQSDWEKWRTGRTDFEAWMCQESSTEVQGGGTFESGSYVYAMRCLEDARNCEIRLSLGLADPPVA